MRIGNTPLPVEESTKFLGLRWDSHLSFMIHISVLKTQCKEALNLMWVVAHLKWGGDRDTLLMLYRAIVRSKLDYGCIVYGRASNTNLRQLDSIRLAKWIIRLQFMDLRWPRLSRRSDVGLVCHIMNLLWSLSDKGTCVRFCWVPSHCGIGGNERVDQLAKENLDQDIDPLASVHYAYMKPLVNFYIQKLVQTKWDVAVHGRDLYLVKPNTGATEEVPAPNQSWRGCNHPTSNWPHQGHQIPYLVPRTADRLSLMWSYTDHWPYTPGVCIVTWMLCWILHSRLVECSLRDNSWDLHSGIPVRSRVFLSDMM